MHKYNVAGVLIGIESNDLKILNRLKSFTASFDCAPDLKVSINGINKIVKPGGKLLLDEGLKWQRDYKLNRTYVYKLRFNSDEISAMLSVDGNWSEALISYINNDTESIFTATVSLLEVLFRNNILFHEGIVIHASAIKWKEKGIAFSAPSGTGKSTQAILWKRFMKAEILNDDRPAIRLSDNQAFTFGTPWSGESIEFSRNSAGLSAIIVLEQARTNSIIELSKHEAVKNLLPRCFLPYHDAELMKSALHKFERIIAVTPVYLLKCTPDRGAVELVQKCME